MRRWLMAGLIVLFTLGLVPGIVAGDDQWDNHTWAQLADLVNDAISASNDFMSQANASSVDAGTIVGLTSPLANQLNQINQQIADLPSAPNSTVADAIMSFHDGIIAYVGGLTEMQASYSTSDAARWNNAIDEINRGIDDMDQAKETFRQEDPRAAKAEEAQQIHQLIVAGAIICAVLSVVLLALGLRGGQYEADKARAAVFLMMFKTSLIPTLGFLITLGSYALAKNGGTYLIATGAMLFGGFRLVRQIVLYATEIRPRLNDLGAAERLLDQQPVALQSLLQTYPGSSFAAAVAKQFQVPLGAAAIVAAQLTGIHPDPTSPITDSNARSGKSG